MKTARQRYAGEFKAKVALEAIRGDLTLAELAELASKHGIHPTMIATWKRQAIDGMAATFSGAGEAAKAAGDAEVEKLHAKIGQLVVERDFLSRGSRDERRAASADDRTRACQPVDRGAMSAGVDQPILLLLCAGSGDGRDDGADGGDRRLVPRSPMVWQPPDGPAPSATRPHGRASAGATLDGEMGLSPIYQRPRTSDPHPEHRIYPYLLRDLEITRPNQVWCADITYLPMRRGFLYLVAIMDWASRKVLAWRLSNTMDAEFCVAASKEALARFGKPEIFNTDQGASSRVPTSPACCARPRCGSAWTGAAAGWTTSSSSGSGGRLSTSAST